MGQTESLFIQTHNDEVIEEPHPVPGTADDGVEKALERLVHSFCWPGMKRDVQIQLASCPS